MGWNRTPSTVDPPAPDATSTTSYPAAASVRHSLRKMRTSSGRCTEVRCTTRAPRNPLISKPGLLFSPPWDQPPEACANRGDIAMGGSPYFLEFGHLVPVG